MAGERQTEFRVVWRWRTDRYREEFSQERERIYKTERGARQRLDKLRSNGGEFDKYEEYDDRYDPGFVKVRMRLDYARMEHREVGPWRLHPSEMDDS